MSSILVGATKYWEVAQLVELLTVNQRVVGSSPTFPAKSNGVNVKVNKGPVAQLVRAADS